MKQTILLALLVLLGVSQALTLDIISNTTNVFHHVNAALRNESSSPPIRPEEGRYMYKYPTIENSQQDLFAAENRDTTSRTPTLTYVDSLTSSEDDDDTSLYTDQQATILGYLHYLSAPLSVIGSTLIIHSLLSTRQSNLRPPFRRLMLGISLNDLVTSLTWILMSPWAFPKNLESSILGSHGSVASCTAMGFLLNFNVGACYYSAFLALYFLLQVRFQLQPQTFARCVEPWFHLLGILLPVVSGTYATATQNMNPIPDVPGACWVRPFPSGCDARESEVECIRGGSGNSLLFTRILGSGSIALCFVAILVSMVLLVLKVLQTERRMQQYRSEASSSTLSTECTTATTRTSKTKPSVLAGLQRTKACGIQGLVYTLVFFLSFFPFVLLQLKEETRENRTYFFVVVCIFKLLHPLQGFSNFLVYSTKSGARLQWFCQTSEQRMQRMVHNRASASSARSSSALSFPQRLWARLVEESVRNESSDLPTNSTTRLRDESCLDSTARTSMRDSSVAYNGPSLVSVLEEGDGVSSCSSKSKGREQKRPKTPSTKMMALYDELMDTQL